MNQVFVGGIALIVALTLWGAKKGSKASFSFKAQKNSFPNSQDISSLVIDKKLITSNKAKNLTRKNLKPFSNDPLLKSIETKKQLNKLISSNPDDRLLAIQIASKWANKKAIPFLKRGLKDSDSRVVIAAASAMAYYKGKNPISLKGNQKLRPPLNVSRIR
tara:strand:- start:1218 stop:1700 length:483 start_codon:yes stop_codon:yes gene_type:complete